MATQFCPECHQPLLSTETVAGVRLTKFKVDLFHYIRTHPGMTSIELAQHFYNDGSVGTSVTVRAHIHQINEALSDVGVRIQGGQITGYHVVVRSST